MAINAQQAKELQIQELRDLIVRKIVRLGCACAPDLVGQIQTEISSDDLIQVLESLVKDGVLQHKKDRRDPREYKEPYQVIYELAK